MDHAFDTANGRGKHVRSCPPTIRQDHGGFENLDNLEINVQTKLRKVPQPRFTLLSKKRVLNNDGELSNEKDEAGSHR
jgi:hypothetical protein